MRALLAPSIALLVGCTKPNPNRCCTTEADCASVGLPVGMTCDDGRVCRGHVCLHETCETAADCDLLAPYCAAPDGECQEACTDDVHCPGNGEPAEQKFCVTGACAQCRDSSDCGGTTPVCGADGACVACVDHAQCPSGACTAAGTCADENQIGYVDPTGSTSSECTKASPCSTIERALGLVPARLYIVIKPGTYVRTGSLTITDARWLIGSGASRPILDRSDDGPVVLAQGAVDLHLEGLEITGATGDPQNGPLLNGYGVYCRATSSAPAISLRDVLVTGNRRGVGSLSCAVTIKQSTFNSNSEHAMELRDGTATIDRCLVENNGRGLVLDNGSYKATNNMIVRNHGSGIDLYSTASNTIEFNTIVDNTFDPTSTYGFLCDVATPTSFPSNIIARNSQATSISNCTFPSSIIIDTDISPLKFKQPDVAPYDYHLLPGSIAIDSGTVSSLDHDIDGDMRPKGAGRDVGADEAQ